MAGIRRQFQDGNDTEDVAAAIEEAQRETDRPSLILVHTHIGYGSPKKQDNFSSHGNPLGEEELQAAKKALGWPTMDKFYLPRGRGRFLPQALRRRRAGTERMGREVGGLQAKNSRRKPPNSS